VISPLRLLSTIHLAFYFQVLLLPHLIVSRYDNGPLICDHDADPDIQPKPPQQVLAADVSVGFWRPAVACPCWMFVDYGCWLSLFGHPVWPTSGQSPAWCDLTPQFICHDFTLTSCSTIVGVLYLIPSVSAYPSRKQVAAIIRPSSLVRHRKAYFNVNLRHNI
jgi:hypothetical protein